MVDAEGLVLEEGGFEASDTDELVDAGVFGVDAEEAATVDPLEVRSQYCYS